MEREENDIRRESDGQTERERGKERIDVLADRDVIDKQTE